MTIFVNPQFNKYIDIDYSRYQRAKELGVDFDTRPSFQAFFEEKKKEPSLSPNYYFAQNHLTRGGHGDYPSIQNFIQLVKSADASNSKEIRMPISQAKNLAFTLGITMARLEGDLEKLVKEDQSGANEIIEINMDAGNKW